jgi:hypothetical protein
MKSSTGAQQRVEAVAARAQDAQRHADHEADDGGREHQGRRHNGLIPETRDADHQHAGQHEDAEAPVQSPHAQRCDPDHHQPGRDGQQAHLDVAGEALDQAADHVEQPPTLIQQQLDAGVDQVSQRQQVLAAAQQVLDKVSWHGGCSRS